MEFPLELLTRIGSDAAVLITALYIQYRSIAAKVDGIEIRLDRLERLHLSNNGRKGS